MKEHTEQLEEELRQYKNQVKALNISLEQSRESYKERSRKCRQYERMLKAATKTQTEVPSQRVMTAQPSGRQPLVEVMPSPKFARNIIAQSEPSSSARPLDLHPQMQRVDFSPQLKFAASSRF
ncbi:hypothetical protein THRCLA_06843, partial [Thraustotheca clavata]